jgi:hypothetical protein
MPAASQCRIALWVLEHHLYDRGVHLSQPQQAHEQFACCCHMQVQKKKALLESEGIKFDGFRVASTGAVLKPEDF